MSGRFSAEDAVQKVGGYADAGRHCAPSVLQVMQEFYGMENDMVLWASLGFPAGIGRCQDVCGALVGGVMAIGVDSGRKVADRNEAYSRAVERAEKLYRAFRETFGHVKCLDLVGPIVTNHEYREWFRSQGLSRTKCRKYMEFVVRTMVEWEELSP